MSSETGHSPDELGRLEEPIGGLSPEDSLTGGPFLVKVDRYGSVSGLVKVKVPLGMLTIVPAPAVGGFPHLDSF